MRYAVHRYGPGAASPAVATTRGPLSAYAPVSNRQRTSRASRRPSAVAAVRIQQRMLCRRVVTIDSATLFWIFTGRPALRASATVRGSIFVYDFDPNPPPRYGTWTRTFAIGTPNRSAISARTRNGC